MSAVRIVGGIGMAAGGCSITFLVNVCELLNEVVKGLLSGIGLWKQFVDSE